MFSLIACIGKNRELGYRNQLIFKIPEDMAFFKHATMGHKVVMGRKTWESLPSKLPGRANYVVSKNNTPSADYTITDLSHFIKQRTSSPEEIFIIGGGTIYREFLPFAQNIYLTEVDSTAEADTFFPLFDKSAYSRYIIKKRASYSIVKYTKLI